MLLLLTSFARQVANVARSIPEKVESWAPLRVLAAWAVSRALAVSIALAASEQAPSRRMTLGSQDVLERVASVLARWDGGWYRAIVSGGYVTPDGTASSAVAFFPLYPFTVKILSSTLGARDVWVAPALSTLCALIAGALLYQIVKQRADAAAAYWAVLFFFFAPSSIHLSAYYTESFFLAASLGCYLAARDGRWWGVALLGAAATATRPTGFLLVAAIFVDFWQQRGFRLRPLREVAGSHLAIAASSLGAMAYAAYLHVTFGSVSVYFRAQSTEWPRRFHPYTLFRMIFDVEALTSASVETLLQGFVPAMIGLAGTLWLLHLRRLGDAIIVFGTLFLALGGGTFESTQRYMLSLFPLYAVFAIIPGQTTKILMLVVSACFMGYWSALFGGGWHFT